MLFTWPEIALALLKLANIILGDMRDARQFKAGQEAEIAKISAKILQKTAAGKAMMEKVNALSSADVDAGLAGLEPK
jgi:hypothetical protein